MPDEFTQAERAVLQQHFSNIDGPVFALINLPDVVKGALFARYSRSPRSLRRLFLDEFADQMKAPEPAKEQLAFDAGVARAEELYERVLVEYGDDSVAQLVAVHVALEDASNILTKVVEWGRLMSYLEQSTRYIPYLDRPNGRWRYHVPSELEVNLDLRRRYTEAMDRCFSTYTKWFDPMQELLRREYPPRPGDSKTAYRISIRAKACDILRGLLPAATTANVGLFGSAQAFETLLIRLNAHPLEEARQAGAQILAELRKVIPVFMRRVDRVDRGAAWSRYLSNTADAMSAEVQATFGTADADENGTSTVKLTDYDEDGELKVLAAAIHPYSRLHDREILQRVASLSPQERERLLKAYIGDRVNRRHKPGRALERTDYRFEITSDYGAFRDLQRHRMMTIEWQPLSTNLGFCLPDEIRSLGSEAESDWKETMRECEFAHDSIADFGLTQVAPYAVPMAFRIRYSMQLNAREAMHMIELRTSPQGHPSYRAICQQMLDCIEREAQHVSLARAMSFADRNGTRDELERLDSELRKEERIGLSIPPEFLIAEASRT